MPLPQFEWTLGKLIRSLREDREWTLDDLREHAPRDSQGGQIGTTTLQKYEKDKIDSPDLTILSRIAQAFDPTNSHEDLFAEVKRRNGLIADAGNVIQMPPVVPERRTTDRLSDEGRLFAKQYDRLSGEAQFAIQALLNALRTAGLMRPESRNGTEND